MKLIAHRGGSFGRENSLETISCAAKLGADAVECDIRRTSDGKYVIFHDANLLRFTGESIPVSEITFEKMEKNLRQHGHKLLSFEQLAEGYVSDAPILIHIKMEEYDIHFAKMIVNSGLPLMVGVVSENMLHSFSPLLPKERILAFLPNLDSAEQFYNGGAGIFRLWEPWLSKCQPNDMKKAFPGVQIYVMACNLQEIGTEIPLESMDGSVQSLEHALESGADGILLNNIYLALDWKRKRLRQHRTERSGEKMPEM